MRNSKRSVRANRSNWFNLSVVSILVIGGALVLLSRNPNSAGNVGPKLSGKGGQVDHWHAALGVNICGKWEPAPVWPITTAAQKLGRKDNNTIYAGLHTHQLADGSGDGVIHMEPAVTEEAGRNAKVGRYMKYAGWKLSGDSMSLWPGTDGKAIKRPAKWMSRSRAARQARPTAVSGS